MKTKFLENIIKELIQKATRLYFKSNFEISSISTYQIPGEKRGNIFIVNLLTEYCLEEEEKYELENKIKDYYENSRFTISSRAPFSSTLHDKLLINFSC